MDDDSLSFGYTEIKLNAGWEGQGGGLGKLRACVMAAFAFIERSTYTRVYTAFVTVL